MRIFLRPGPESEMSGWPRAFALLLCVTESRCAILSPITLSFKLKSMCITRPAIQCVNTLRSGWDLEGKNSDWYSLSMHVLIRGYIDSSIYQSIKH